MAALAATADVPSASSTALIGLLLVAPTRALAACTASACRQRVCLKKDNQTAGALAVEGSTYLRDSAPSSTGARPGSLPEAAAVGGPCRPALALRTPAGGAACQTHRGRRHAALPAAGRLNRSPIPPPERRHAAASNPRPPPRAASPCCPSSTRLCCLCYDNASGGSRADPRSTGSARIVVVFSSSLQRVDRSADLESADGRKLKLPPRSVDLTINDSDIIAATKPMRALGRRFLRLPGGRRGGARTQPATR
jgi:hypothetical protein